MPCLIISKVVRYGWKESEEATFIINEDLFEKLQQ